MGAALEQAALGLADGEIPIGSVVAVDGAVVGGVRRNDSAQLMRAFLDGAPSSPFARWAETLPV
jgi:hypothetical protein